MHLVGQLLRVIHNVSVNDRGIFQIILSKLASKDWDSPQDDEHHSARNI